MSIKSISSIHDCMQHLGFHTAAATSHTTTAKILIPGNTQSGTINVTFQSNWHCGDGPFLEMDDEIKGFGINYLQFKPNFLEITWNPIDQELFVEGGNYKFTLQF